ncbi:MAG: hypothetical protein KIT60_07255 [Burkholderiaceae bacterium]|nr:hypothetical protein [Burkholderiaceae bacterium]
MDTSNICEPDEPKATCWLRHAILGLLGLVAVLSLVLSFAVEFMATGPDLHRRGHSLLETIQSPSVPDVYASSERPLHPAN